MCGTNNHEQIVIANFGGHMLTLAHGSGYEENLLTGCLMHATV